MTCSVIICTHNPRPAYLVRVLGALQQQTLPLHQWELVIVDNASSPPVGPQMDLTWHPNAKAVAEPSLGLTRARVRGIAESSGDLLVFVDDDNVLDPDYLATALNIARERPYLAALGANISGEFETPPPSCFDGLLGWLAIIKTDRDIWGNSYKLEQLPVGAGLCVTREVATSYAAQASLEPLRLTLDRQGSNLSSGGDTDLVLTAIDLGYGGGVFKALHLTHLIPSSRLTEPYLLQLAEAMSFSEVLRGRLGRGPVKTDRNWKRRLLDWVKTPLIPKWERKLLVAKLHGEARARAVLIPNQN